MQKSLNSDQASMLCSRSLRLDVFEVPSTVMLFNLSVLGLPGSHHVVIKWLITLLLKQEDCQHRLYSAAVSCDYYALDLGGLVHPERLQATLWTWQACPTTVAM